MICACGCGQVTPIAKKTSSRDRTVKGQHVRFFPRHENLGRTRNSFERKCVCGNVFTTRSKRQIFCRACFVGRRRIADKIVQKVKRAKDGHAQKYRDYMLRKKYGLTPPEFDALLAKQKGVCAICGSSHPRWTRGWNIDHDHSTGKIRGILCMPCNWMLGYAADNVETLANAVRYLHQPPASELQKSETS